MKIYNVLACLTFLLSHMSWAQMPHDAIYMNKNLTCAAVVYGNSSWTDYWENSLKRENQNIGKLTSESMTAMISYGITKKFNFIAVVPYVKTHASEGNLLGQEGFQDVSFWLKVKPFSYKGLAGHITMGVSIPMTDYVPDFMPLSIGYGSTVLTSRAILSYNHPSNFYVNGSFAYHLRGNVEVDRDAYLNGDDLTYSNEVPLPDAIETAFRLGYLKKDNQLELFAENFSCTSGDAIRRNDMPYLTNDMEMTQVGVYGKYQPKNIGVNAKLAYVVDGLNAGQATTFSVGLLYLFNLPILN